MPEHQTPYSLLVAAVVGLAGALGCADPDAMPCSRDADCFANEQCVAGECEVIPDSGDSDSKADDIHNSTSNQDANGSNGDASTDSQSNGDSGINDDINDVDEDIECLDDLEGCDPESHYERSTAIAFETDDGSIDCPKIRDGHQPDFTEPTGRQFNLCPNPNDIHFYRLHYNPCEETSLYVTVEIEARNECSEDYLDIHFEDGSLIPPPECGADAYCNWEEDADGLTATVVFELPPAPATTASLYVTLSGVGDLSVRFDYEISITNIQDWEPEDFPG